MAMRFLILTQYYPPEVGAAQTRLAATARELQRRGHEVEVVTGLPNYPEGRIQPNYRRKFAVVENLGSVRVRRTWLLAAKGSGFSRVANYVSFALTSLAGLLSARRPDVLFVESPPLSIAVPAWVMARIWGATLVVNVSDLWPDSAVALGLAGNGPMLTIAGALEKWAYRRADYVTTVTEEWRDTLLQEKGVPPAKVLLLPNGVDVDLLSPLPKDERLIRDLGLQGHDVVLCAGTLGYAAGLDVALDAAKLLSDRPITFLFVGDGSERERLQALAEERGLSNVRFLGAKPLRDVPRLYSIATLGLVTLLDRPLFAGMRPARVMAAMACGKPVVYSAGGGGARIIEDAAAGIVVQPEDPEAIASAILRLVDDPEAAKEMGENGRRCVASSFTWDVLVGQWLSTLKERMRAG